MTAARRLEARHDDCRRSSQYSFGVRIRSLERCRGPAPAPYRQQDLEACEELRPQDELDWRDQARHERSAGGKVRTIDRHWGASSVRTVRQRSFTIGWRDCRGACLTCQGHKRFAGIGGYQTGQAIRPRPPRLVLGKQTLAYRPLAASPDEALGVGQQRREPTVLPLALRESLHPEIRRVLARYLRHARLWPQEPQVVTVSCGVRGGTPLSL
jgi:hypothetical protein